MHTVDLDFFDDKFHNAPRSAASSSTGEGSHEGHHSDSISRAIAIVESGGDVRMARMLVEEEALSMSPECARKGIVLLASVSDACRDALVRMGNTVERLYDAMELSPAARKQKWDTEARNFESIRSMQQTMHIATLEESRRRIKNVSDCLLRAHKSAIGRSSEDWLRKQPPTFWYALSIENVEDELERRAVIGGVLRAIQFHGRAQFPPSLWVRCSAAIDALPPAPLPKPWWKRWAVGWKRGWKRGFTSKRNPKQNGVVFVTRKTTLPRIVVAPHNAVASYVAGPRNPNASRTANG